MKRILSLLFLYTILALNVQAQDDLEALLNQKDSVPQKEYITAAFKGTRVINLHSTEKVAKGALQFLISHRFGAINGGFKQFFGLDQATIRFAFEYGINDYLMIGIGRSTYEKTFDGFIKASIIRQSKGGKGSMPFSLLYFTSIACQTTDWEDPNRTNYFSSRLSYVHQIIIGSKVSKGFSFVVSPTLVHKNLVANKSYPNTTFAIGVGARVKISKRISINGEYIVRIPPADATTPEYSNYANSLSLGVDIETGGHVFQMQFTNSLSVFERGFITETSERWENGGIHFGFNISRDFVLVKKKKEK